MALNKEQIEAVMGMILGTRDKELTCDECLADLAQFAEAELAGREKCEAMRAVQEHLEFCPECKEEYDLLVDALSAIEED